MEWLQPQFLLPVLGMNYMLICFTCFYFISSSQHPWKQILPSSPFHSCENQGTRSLQKSSHKSSWENRDFNSADPTADFSLYLTAQQGSQTQPAAGATQGVKWGRQAGVRVETTASWGRESLLSSSCRCHMGVQTLELTSSHFPKRCQKPGSSHEISQVKICKWSS